MRFSKKDGRLDEDRIERQITHAIENGVNYFDTAYIYHNGKSESILGKVLAKGHRDKVKIATKLPLFMTHSRKDMDTIFETQLKRLQTDYIDYYLLHALGGMDGWQRLKDIGILEFIKEKKQAGQIRRIGFSYHGDKDQFKTVIDDYPWDFCQIQYNYLDEQNQAGTEGLEYAAAKGLGVIVMEPLRGGSLVGKMPNHVQELWNQTESKRSPAEWALRWVWNHPEVTVVLSGMNEEAHIDENIRIAGEALPNSLSDEELATIGKVKDAISASLKVGCTGCGYCMPCPAGVNIPLCFSYYNAKHLFNDKYHDFTYLGFTCGADGGSPSYASLCKKCGKCEKHCPQSLPIRKHLQEVVSDMHHFYFGPAAGLIRGYYKVRRMLNHR